MVPGRCRLNRRGNEKSQSRMVLTGRGAAPIRDPFRVPERAQDSVFPPREENCAGQTFVAGQLTVRWTGTTTSGRSGSLLEMHALAL